MAVPYEYYRIFYYVARYGSFTRAAKGLMNSQPNITRAMNNLEQQLGCRLFLRSHKGVSLTPEGEKLLAHVRIAQEQLQAAENELDRSRLLQSGSVSIGASAIALRGLLLPVLHRFHQAYPGIRIRVTNHSTPQAVAAVKNGSVELATVTTPTGVAPPLREVALMEFRDILIGGPSFAGLRGQTLHIGELGAYPLVCLGRGTGTGTFYDRLFAAYGQLLCPEVEVATPDQVLPMVQHDLGLGFLPRSFAASALERGEVFEIPLAEQLPARSICLVWDKGRPLGAPARQLEKMLRQTAEQRETAMGQNG